MLRRTAEAGFLITWVGFVALVTWLDWLGLFFFAFAFFPVWIGKGLVFLMVVLLLLELLAVLGSEEISRLRRVMLAFGILWLLVLPSIRWTPNKAMIIDTTRLHIGMTEAQARAIMTPYHGGYAGGNKNELVYCRSDDCPDDATLVRVRLVNKIVASIWIEPD
jgi:hypothetical protein